MNFALAALWLYRRVVSPAIHSVGLGGVSQCRFRPTCSEYAEIAIARFGQWRGGMMALQRLARCHPFSNGGLDNVPEA